MESNGAATTTQYLLAWAIQDARDGTVLLAEQAVWLAGVLETRGFPVEQLIGNLQIAAETVESHPALQDLAQPSADSLILAAAACRR